MTCACGCGKPLNPIGARGRPRRYLNGHRPHPPTPNVGVLVDANECWNWQGLLQPSGYGQIRREGRTRSAHRYVYELLRGPIPTHLEFDHLCRNRACVNPDHLEPVARRENLRRGNGTKLTQAKADEIRRLRTEGLTLGAIGRRFRVSPATVHAVVHGQRWGE